MGVGIKYKKSLNQKKDTILKAVKENYEQLQSKFEDKIGRIHSVPRSLRQSVQNSPRNFSNRRSGVKIGIGTKRVMTRRQRNMKDLTDINHKAFDHKLDFYTPLNITVHDGIKT